MATPDEVQTREALARVEREGREPGLGRVIWHELDLKDPRTAKASAESFMQKEDRLDILSQFPITSHDFLTCRSVNDAAQLVSHSVMFLVTYSILRITDLGKPQLNADGIQTNMAIK